MTTGTEAPARRRARQRVIAAVCAGVVAVPALAAFADTEGNPAAAAPACRPRTLILSAMPVELGPLVDATSHAKVASDAQNYVVGRLGGHDAVLALTGIGPVNARRATRDALAHFSCGSRPGIDAVVFSGVAGGDFIGNVTVPTRWTLDQGKHFYAADARMLAVARDVARRGVPLERKAPAGDPACACVTSPDLVATVSVTEKPRVEVGGDGRTTDPFSGRALPCVPGGGDVFGCEPCLVQTQLARDGAAFAPGAVPFADPAFFAGYLRPAATGKHHYVADDEETAAVARVAAQHKVPFLGVRAVSDGAGDPLHLPGFPAQFFYYRQLAADNAAATTLAFLRAWSAAPDA